MTFKEFMDRYSYTARSMAEELDVSVSAVRKWVQRTRIPRHGMMKKIDKFTKGKVSYDDWQ